MARSRAADVSPVTVKLSALPAATVVELAEVMVAVLEVGMTATGVEAAPAPLALVAVTVKAYTAPLVRPVTVHDVVDVEQV